MKRITSLILAWALSLALSPAWAMDLSAPGVQTYTMATRPAASSLAAGTTISIADSTYNLYGPMTTNGTVWNGQFIWTQNIPAIIPGKVTVNTTSPNLTLATSVSRIANGGTFYAWMYLPTMATTPAITLGWYPVQVTGATTAKILNAYAGTEISYSVGAANQSNGTSTGLTDATNEIQMLGIGTTGPNTSGGPLIPGNLLGPNGSIEIQAHFGYSNDSGNKYLGIQMGTSISSTNYIVQATNTTTSDWHTLAVTRNLNSTGQQMNYCASGGAGGGTGTGTGTGLTTAFDTTADQRLGIYAGLAAPATSYVSLNGATIRIVAD